MDKQGYPHPQPVPPSYDAATGYPQPQQPQMGQPTPMQGYQPVVVQPVATQMYPQVGPIPTPMVCPHCHAQIISRVDYEPGAKTHLLAMALCIFGLWCCVCLPYCIDSCKLSNHYCPSCGAYIGSYNK